MLYLAEVKIQNRSFVGGNKTELKLLASQAADQSWSSVSGDDNFSTDTITDTISKGTLYILNLDNNKRLQATPELAGSRIVNYLRFLSRSLDKSKSQDSEIEEWKTSLRLQGEQIGRRQSELDQQEQIITQQRQELANLEEEKEKLNNAWEQLRKDEARSNEHKDKLNSLLQELTQGSFKPDNLPDLLTTINSQQQLLDDYWQQLESDKHSLPNRRQDLETKQNQLQQNRQDLETKQNQLQQVLISQESNQNLVREKEKNLKVLNRQLELVERLEQEVSVLADDSDDNQIDINVLEGMPLGELEENVNNLQQETSKLVNFVNLQEEELSLQADEVKTIEQKVTQASEVDKFSLESELADAEEAMKLLNETLVGQRKTLKKQQKNLNEHLKILSRRKGVADIDFSETINVKPLVTEMEKQRQYIVEKQNTLNNELNQLLSSQSQLEQEVSQLRQEYQEHKTQVEQKEKQLLQIYQQVTETECNISLFEQILEPVQEQLNTLADNLNHLEPSKDDSISNLVNDLQSML